MEKVTGREYELDLPGRTPLDPTQCGTVSQFLAIYCHKALMYGVENEHKHTKLIGPRKMDVKGTLNDVLYGRLLSELSQRIRLAAMDSACNLGGP